MLQYNNIYVYKYKLNQSTSQYRLLIKGMAYTSYHKPFEVRAVYNMLRLLLFKHLRNGLILMNADNDLYGTVWFFQ